MQEFEVKLGMKIDIRRLPVCTERMPGWFGPGLPCWRLFGVSWMERPSPVSRLREALMDQMVYEGIIRTDLAQSKT